MPCVYTHSMHVWPCLTTSPFCKCHCNSILASIVIAFGMCRDEGNEFFEVYEIWWFIDIPEVPNTSQLIFGKIHYVWSFPIARLESHPSKDFWGQLPGNPNARNILLMWSGMIHLDVPMGLGFAQVWQHGKQQEGHGGYWDSLKKTLSINMFSRSLSN